MWKLNYHLQCKMSQSRKTENIDSFLCTDWEELLGGFISQQL